MEVELLRLLAALRLECSTIEAMLTNIIDALPDESRMHPELTETRPFEQRGHSIEELIASIGRMRPPAVNDNGYREG